MLAKLTPVVSISKTFYVQLLSYYSLARKLQCLAVSRLTFCKTLSYKKSACKKLVKLTPRDQLTVNVDLEVVHATRDEKVVWLSSELYYKISCFNLNSIFTFCIKDCGLHSQKYQLFFCMFN
jgi:hypothetical protein